jgi:hypothetical protein
VAWIESHQELEDHPKMTLFMTKTGLDLNESIGLLHRLWWWSLKYAEDGVLSKYDSSQFLVRLTDKIDPDKLLKILIECKFIENNSEILKINDWFDYAGRYLTGKYRTSNPKKLKGITKLYKSVSRRSKVCLKSDNLPNLTLPTLPNNKYKGKFVPPNLDEVSIYCKERQNQVNPQVWIDHYVSNGWMVGKNKMKDWKAAVRTWEHRDKYKSTKKKCAYDNNKACDLDCPTRLKCPEMEKK